MLNPNPRFRYLFSARRPKSVGQRHVLAARQPGWATRTCATVISAFCAQAVISADCPPAEDLDHSGLVDSGDLAIVLGAWGTCGLTCPADISGDGTVDASDLAVVLGAWGTASAPIIEAALPNAATMLPSLSLGTCRYVGCADVNADGQLDLVAIHGASVLHHIVLSDGSIQTTQFAIPGIGSSTLQTVAFLHINGDAYREFVELYNASSDTLDLTGCVLTDAGGAAAGLTIGTVLLAPGAYAAFVHEPPTPPDAALATDPLGAGVDMRRGFFEIGEEPGGLQDVVDTHVLPGELRRVLLGGRLGRAPVHGEGTLGRRDVREDGSRGRWLSRGERRDRELDGVADLLGRHR